MTQYTQDFGGYTTDAAPSDWTERWNTGHFASTVRADSALEGGKYLEQTVSTIGTDKVLSYDALDSDANRDNIELLVRFQSNDFDTQSNFMCVHHVRGSGATGSENSYMVNTFDHSAIQITKVVSGTGTTLGTYYPNAAFTAWFEVNEWYYIRFRVNGTSLKARVWHVDQDEPVDWQIDVTDSAVTGVGWAGLGRLDSTGGTTKYDFVSFGTNGDTAPMSPIDTGLNMRVTQVPVQVVSRDATPVGRVTQVPVQVVSRDATPIGRVTQVPVLVVRPNISEGSDNTTVVTIIM